MKHLSNLRLTCFAAAALAGMLSSGVAPAFPPAPHHTLFGLVRNQYGDPLDVTDATVYLQVAGRDGVRAAVAPSRDPGVNYRLRVPMDSLTRPDLYQASALGLSQPFRLRVQIGNITYLPLEMAVHTPVLGQPAESTRVDLTLGEDTDGDGLPDAWEQAIIAVYGGTLASITPGGDADGDGISNLDEYLAGTLPFDPSDGFRLSLASVRAGTATLQLFAIRGRTYSLQASVDLKQWTPVKFRVAAGGAASELQSSYSATDMRLLNLEVPPDPASNANRYFKALVQ
jgi:hypothetical protein